jgi:hypothetical protein
MGRAPLSIRFGRGTKKSSRSIADMETQIPRITNENHILCRARDDGPWAERGVS